MQGEKIIGTNQVLKKGHSIINDSTHDCFEFLLSEEEERKKFGFQVSENQESECIRFDLHGLK